MPQRAILLAILLLMAPLPAQPAPHPLMAPRGYDVDSMVHKNGGTTPAIVWSQQVSIPGATSLQLRFAGVELAEPEDYVEVHNPLDGETMRLDSAVLKQWRNHSAYFNGDVVDVRLVLSPGSQGRVRIDRVNVGIPSPSIIGPRPETQCGSADNRSPSSDARVCRLMRNNFTTGGGCTGWLISNTSTVVSAGHCADPFPDFLVVCEFNVPFSTSSGAVQHPPVADQYPVHQESVEWENLGTGDDWAVMRLHPNSSGDTAFTRQGASFTIASSNPTYIPPFIVPTIRITGNGADFNNNTRNFVQQTHTGPLAGFGSDTLSYRVDTEGGNSGGPVIDEASGTVIGIHTNGGCTGLGGSNLGQSIFTSDVSNAIDDVRGNHHLSMSSAFAYTRSSTNIVFDYTPDPNDWNVVCVTSPSDWDVETETNPGSNTRVVSAAAGNSADVIVANGNLGNLAPFSGRIYRFSGSSSVRAMARQATTINVGSPFTTTISNASVVRVYQFNVTSSGTYDLTVVGDTSYRWRLMEPGSNSNWRSWFSGDVRSGTVGDGGASNVSLNTGWHCLIITRDGGTTNPSPTDLTINICDATSFRTLTPTPTNITAACQDFVVGPVAGRWNGAVISGTGDWDLNIGSAHSSVGSNNANFALFNGHLGTVTPTRGSFIRNSSSGSAVAQELESTTIPVNSSYGDTIGAGEVARLYEFDIPSSGSYDISVTGGSGMFARVYGPGSSATWIDRPQSIGSSVLIGTSFMTRSLSAGHHALVIYRNGGALTSAQTIEIRVCDSVSPLSLSQSATGTTFSEACRRYDLSSPDSGWNVVGVTGDTAGYVLSTGRATSDEGGFDCSYTVANGHEGSVSPTTGTVSRQSGSGSGRIAHGFTTTISLNSTYNAFWSSSYVVRAFEFEITSTDSYDITVNAQSRTTFTSGDTPWWRIHRAGSGANWQTRDDAVSNLGIAVTNNATRTLTLDPGWHCIVVYSNAGTTSVSDRVELLVEPTPNPVPNLTAISPAAIPVGSSATTISVTGGNFVPGADVRLNGASLSTNFLSSTNLQAVVPASALTTAGTSTITVFNPAPGGGTSSGLTLTVENPVPSLARMAPTSAVENSGPRTLTVDGSDFLPTSRITWDGGSLPTVYVSSTRLRTTLTNTELTPAGSNHAVAVVNPGPGGGTSSPNFFTIEYPTAQVASISPSTRVAGTSGFTLTVNGSRFYSNSRITIDGSSRPTTFVNSNRLRTSVSSSRIDEAGPLLIGVVNPAPGGGASNTVTLTVEAPVFTSTIPAGVPIQPFGSSVNVTVNGQHFHSGSTVYANSDPLATTFVSSTRLTATIPSTSQPMLRVDGGLQLSVGNSDEAFSSIVNLPIGGSSNKGLIYRDPIAPAPGEGYSTVLSGGEPGERFTLILDFAPVTTTSIYPFADPAADYSLNVRPANPLTGDWFVWFDGIGIFEPPQGFARYDATGEFRLAGLAVPNPLIGIDLTVQAVYLDPTVPVGYRMTWARHADRL